MSSSLFVIVFSFSFLIFGRVHPTLYRDDYFWLFSIFAILLYPIHKVVHYFSLFEYRRSVKLRIRIDHQFIPILRMRIKTLIPKRRYILTLLAPFILINGLLIILALAFPHFTHYFCLLLSYHCSICLVDILYVKNLILAPKNSVIEETPKGYEILVPPTL